MAQIGDFVVKESGDYRFTGWIVAVVKKRSGEIRYVVENVDGLMLILKLAQFRVFVPRPFGEGEDHDLSGKPLHTP